MLTVPVDAALNLSMFELQQNKNTIVCIAMSDPIQLLQYSIDIYCRMNIFLVPNDCMQSNYLPFIIIII